MAVVVVLVHTLVVYSARPGCLPNVDVMCSSSRCCCPSPPAILPPTTTTSSSSCSCHSPHQPRRTGACRFVLVHTAQWRGPSFLSYSGSCVSRLSLCTVVRLFSPPLPWRDVTMTHQTPAIIRLFAWGFIPLFLASRLSGSTPLDSVNSTE